MLQKKKIRKGYFFGYGADQEADMLKAITGRDPEVFGRAVLKDYELRIQKLDEITNKGENPREILRKSWGDKFVSYVIVPKKGSEVEGTLFHLPIHDRNLVDGWELVKQGWYRRQFVKVLAEDGKHYHAETQVLRRGQKAELKAKPSFKSWLLPKTKFLRIAEKDRHNLS